MLFNTWRFGVFLALVFGVYWLLPKRRSQNILLLAASYYFYSVWDWRFSGLMLASTVVDYICGAQIADSANPKRRRAFMVVTLIANFGLLGFFKYYGFFVESLEGVLLSAGFDATHLRLDIVLPVGISFYTFQTLSYTIDIYRGQLKPVRSFLDFALFVSFFPQLVAGPIERASALIPQIESERTLDARRFGSGVWLIFFGLWKKIFIADNMALIADGIFSTSVSATGFEAYVGVLAFALQIYGDFSAYSDIARGSARILGFELMCNFNLPYFAVNPSDFWRRWHISLSTWLRDYLYIPLGGNRFSEAKTYRNLFLTMGLGGLWHGASWNFLWWGIYHGALLAGHRMLFRSKGPAKTGLGRFACGLVMFHFTLLGWLLFRATRRTAGPDGVLRDDSFAQMIEMLTSFKNGAGFDAPTLALFWNIVFVTTPLLLLHIYQHRTKRNELVLPPMRLVRCLITAALLFLWLYFGAQMGESFIYFQF